MNALKHYRWGLGCDALFAFLGVTLLDEGQVNGALLTTAIAHSIVASLIYYRGKNLGGFSKMDHVFLVLGQLGILLFLLLLYRVLIRHYVHAAL